MNLPVPHPAVDFQTAVDPLWYKDAIIYQTHIRAFADSKSDGIGDFAGLTSRLGYIQDLGVTTIWLLPFYPSPLKDDGYDIADYREVNPIYGDLGEFQAFLEEAHARGLRVITELVLNHTSDQHQWFQRARQAPAGDPARDFYVWSDSVEKYREARIIFKDFEASNWTWDETAQAYYWHRFYSHQPDLNFDNPAVQRAVLEVLDYWLAMGVDGFRLDAVPYLYERDGTSCENLPETHAFLKKLRAHVDARYPHRVLLAEANQWPEDAVAYFGSGDECQMAFHFPLMPRLFMAVQQEDRYPILDIMQQTPDIPATCQWTIFLRNHDELTLEMVTDEERDYMYRVYARDPQARINLGIRRRLAPLLGNNRRKIELMNGLLLSLPGTPVIYYGDELGMGDNIYLGDRDAVRTPMQWSADRNAGFSRANPQKLFLPVVTDPEFHFTALNVETAQNSPHSLLWWMKRLIALRKRYKAFSRGSLEFLAPDNSKVLAFLRRHEGEVVLVVANLSRFAQYAELDLSAFQGATPIEMFGQTKFPTIGELPYLVTLGPHSFYWLCLTCAAAGTQAQDAPPRVQTGVWTDLFERSTVGQLTATLPRFLVKHRWFAGKARIIQSAEIEDVANVAPDGDCDGIRLAIVRVLYTEGEPEHYQLPLGFATGHAAERLLTESPALVLAEVAETEGPRRRGVVFDAAREPALWSWLFESIARRRRIKSQKGELASWPSQAFAARAPQPDVALAPTVLRTDQSNNAATLGGQFILKLFRKLDLGVNPELEVTRYLTEEARFPNSPALAGATEYRHADGMPPMTLAILHDYLANTQQAWEFTFDEIGRYFERVASEFSLHDLAQELNPAVRWIDLVDREPTALAQRAIGPYLHSAALLGQRTAELHLALAGAKAPAFAPEPFTPFYQRGLFQGMRNQARRALGLLKRQSHALPAALRPEAQRIIELEGDVIHQLRQLADRSVTALRIRCHGDYHLGQVLYTGKDFAIIDFEGEPMRAISERKIKRSPLRDVAGMIRSFHYASYAGLLAQAPGVGVRTEDASTLAPWSRLWFQWNSAVFLKSYLTHVSSASFVPQNRDEVRCLLETYLLEKSLYELEYEMNNRPDWVAIPMRGVLDALNAAPLTPPPAQEESGPPAPLE